MKKINDNKNKEEILKEIAEVQNELFELKKIKKYLKESDKRYNSEMVIRTIHCRLLGHELFDKRVKTKVNSKILIQIIDELINKKMEYLDKVINYEKVSEENEEE